MTKTFIGIYSAYPGCPACGAFTPLLVHVYHQLQETGRSFEVVLVSLGVSDATLQQYMAWAEMPWLAVSSRSKERREAREALRLPDERGRGGREGDDRSEPPVGPGCVALPLPRSRAYHRPFRVLLLSHHPGTGLPSQGSRRGRLPG